MLKAKKPIPVRIGFVRILSILKIHKCKCLQSQIVVITPSCFIRHEINYWQ